MKKIFKYSIIIGLLSIISFSIYLFKDLERWHESDKQIKGIDISHYQTVTDWGAVSDQVDFVIIKATEGATWKDAKFNKYWQKSKRHNIIRGAYHFFSPNVSAEQQFNNFKNSVTLSKGDLPPFLDVEDKSIDMTEVNKWLQLAEDHYGVKPIVYSDFMFYKIFMNFSVEDYPLWLYTNENYYFKPDFDQPKCLFWQYSQIGKLKGIKDIVDLDGFLGDKKSFDNFLIH